MEVSSSWSFQGHFSWEGEDAAFCPSLYCALVIYGVTGAEQYVVEFPCFPCIWWYFIETGSFPVFNFGLYYVEFILRKLTLGDFLIRFLKYSFHICIRSSWLVAFTLAHEVLFFLHTSFTLCHAIRDCLSSNKVLILLIWSLFVFCLSF